MQSQFKREHSRGNAHFIHTETLLFLAFIFKRASSFWCLSALRTNALGGSESVRFEYSLLAFSDVPIVSKLCGALCDEMSADIFLYT